MDLKIEEKREEGKTAGIRNKISCKLSNWAARRIALLPLACLSSLFFTLFFSLSSSVTYTGARMRPQKDRALQLRGVLTSLCRLPYVHFLRLPRRYAHMHLVISLPSFNFMLSKGAIGASTEHSFFYPHDISEWENRECLLKPNTC